MSKSFDKDIEFYIGGVKVGGSTITVSQGEIDTSGAEDEFFAILRKHEPSIIEEGNDYEKGYIVEHLTPAQEELLKTAHMAQYHGTDDDAPDDYEDWMMNLTAQELKSELNL